MTEYEFSPTENKDIDRLRQRLFHCSTGLFLLGILLMLGAHLFRTGEQVWVQMIAGGFFVILGVVFMRPLDNLRRITRTQGSDIRELMVAVDDLRAAFATGGILFGTLAFLTALGILRLATM